MEPTWRPPTGSEILFMNSGVDGNGITSIHAITLDTGKVTTVLASTPDRYRGHPSWSPDGSMLSFGEWTGATIDVQTHILPADGTPVRVLPIPPGAMWQAPWSWSNDGTRMIVERGYSGDSGVSRPAVVPIDGKGTGVEIRDASVAQIGCCGIWEWAPDDSSILGTPNDGSGASLEQVLLVPGSGTSHAVSWTSVSQPSWQRLAP